MTAETTEILHTTVYCLYYIIRLYQQQVSYQIKENGVGL